MSMSQNYGNRGGAMAGTNAGVDGKAIAPQSITLPDGGFLAIPANADGTPSIRGTVDDDTGLRITSGRLRLVAGGNEKAQCLAGGGFIVQSIAQLNHALKPVAEGTKTSTYTVTTSDLVVPYDASGGAFQMNLPASPEVDQLLLLIEVGGSTNNLTLSGNGNNVNGSSSVVIATAYKVTVCKWDGTEWVAGV